MFVKYNQSAYSDSLIKEANGLACLKAVLDNVQHPYIKIPRIYEVNTQRLCLEQITPVQSTDEHQYRFGLGLAQLHKQKQSYFGFEEDNYIGLNPQKNLMTDNWGRFFVEQRLQFQIDLIKDGAINKEFSSVSESVKNDLEAFLNEHCDYPSLLHGDLWSGNVMFSRDGDQSQVWLIDPAVYYGDREVDIAMTEMFGGFSKAFYSAYDSELSLTAVYQQKKKIYNLYHYLNHYNLFGSGYLAHCKMGFDFLRQQFNSS